MKYIEEKAFAPETNKERKQALEGAIGMVALVLDTMHKKIDFTIKDAIKYNEEIDTNLINTLNQRVKNLENTIDELQRLDTTIEELKELRKRYQG